ncbi:hypothetical protein BC831DRAFT_444800 [Entophlyctis helioformis]|nr:hypothetical protein BC831DRAFT_444800 [Entophlyctis helioformis]
MAHQQALSAALSLLTSSTHNTLPEAGSSQRDAVLLLAAAVANSTYSTYSSYTTFTSSGTNGWTTDAILAWLASTGFLAINPSHLQAAVLADCDVVAALCSILDAMLACSASAHTHAVHTHRTHHAHHAGSRNSSTSDQPVYLLALSSPLLRRIVRLTASPSLPIATVVFRTVVARALILAANASSSAETAASASASKAIVKAVKAGVAEPLYRMIRQRTFADASVWFRALHHLLDAFHDDPNVLFRSPHTSTISNVIASQLASLGVMDALEYLSTSRRAGRRVRAMARSTLAAFFIEEGPHAQAAPARTQPSAGSASQLADMHVDSTGGVERRYADTSYINYAPNKDLSPRFSFQTYADMLPRPYTADERAYMSLISDFLNQPQWWTLLGDDNVMERWRARIMSRTPQSSLPNDAVPLMDVSEMLDKALAHLRRIVDAKLHRISVVPGEIMTVSPGAAEGTFVSHDAVPENMRLQLNSFAVRLENVPPDRKEWDIEPVVLNLVDPSFYYLRFGHTACATRATRLAECAASIHHDGTTRPISMMSWDHLQRDQQIAGRAKRDELLLPCRVRVGQWIPAEFRVNGDGSVGIHSYINNLHPVWHADAYAIIAGIFQRLVPLYELVLGFTATDPPEFRLDRSPSQAPSDSVASMAGPAEPDSKPTAGLPFLHDIVPASLRNRNLQVIVRMYNYYLGPETPSYDPNLWEMEGTATELIVASGVFFYSMQNLAPVYMMFEKAVAKTAGGVGGDSAQASMSASSYLSSSSSVAGSDKPDLVQQRNPDSTQPVQGASRPQDAGRIEIREGLCIVHPNVSHQHALSTLRLASSPQPDTYTSPDGAPSAAASTGHLKMLVFQLVDPSRRIVSTAHVAPQQPDWTISGFHAIPDLPLELWSLIRPYVVGPGTGFIDFARAQYERYDYVEYRTRVEEAFDAAMFGGVERGRVVYDEHALFDVEGEGVGGDDDGESGSDEDMESDEEDEDMDEADQHVRDAVNGNASGPQWVHEQL